ncbi:MAG TPA: FAD-dependent oxidoreductase [Ideonella sp.]|nr:FAD-dependent oxidoreductase [Ideonella sp.]
MHIAVIGAGLAGVTTAYELARDGHEVTVFERRGGIAAEGSFAPACVVAPGLWLAHAAVGAAPGLDPLAARARDLPWRYRRWRAVRHGAQTDRLKCMADLAQFNLDRLQALTAAHQLEYERHTGVMALLHTARHAKHARVLLDEHAGLALPVRWLTAEQARAVEPALNPALPLEGALHWPAGETANGRQFAHALKGVAQQLGARFQFQLEVEAIAAASGPGPQVELHVARRHELGDSALAPHGTGDTTVPDDAMPDFDAAVLCSAEAVAHLLGNRIASPHFIPGHQHSVTAPLREPAEAGEAFAPLGAVLDPASRVTVSRMGERVRAAGGAAYGAPPVRANEAALRHLYRALESCFPGAARTAKALPWVGRQSSSADGLPVVGASGLPGVWLHCGHGASSWAWAAASARLLADQIAGKPALLDTALLAPDRLR